jgi:transposase
LKKKSKIGNVGVKMSQEIPTRNRAKLNQLSTSELVEIILIQQEAIKTLKEEIERLKLSRDLDSKISSKPPSSDLLKKSEKKKDIEKKKRKPGGQPGHQGKTRKGFERVDRIEILKPEQCSNCRQKLSLVEPEKIETQQVAQLVAKPIEIVEYQRHHIRCACCQKVTKADWSPEIIPGQDLAIRLQGLLGWLGNYGHLPYEKQQEFLWELGDIKIGVGTLVKTNQRISGAIKKSVSELKNWVISSQPPLNIDETPWFVKGVKEWLWVFTNPQFCLFRAADTRGREEIKDQIGEQYSGVIISDDFNVYNGYDVNSQQKCLAHLRRHAQRLVKTPGLHNKSIGEELTTLVDEAFRHHRLVRANQNHNIYGDWATKFKLKIQQFLTRWCQKAGYEAGKLLRNLKLKAVQWWYFLDHLEIPPDNNLAERALRLAVTKRKVSGGSRSMARFEDTANNLTAILTCRFQGRSVMNFFTSVLKAFFGIEEQPSLIPDSYT